MHPYFVIAIWRRPTGGFCGFCRRVLLATADAREAEKRLAERIAAPYLHLYRYDAEGRLRRAN